MYIPDRPLLLLFLLCWALSCVDPPYPRELVLQHVPTAIAVAALTAGRQRMRLGRTSEQLVLAFLALHVLGARYLYSYVPYDDWAAALVGRPISSMFGWTRNHYDRLVHLAYGLLLYFPLREAIERRSDLRGASSGALAVQGILASSAFYEIAEWWVALTFASEWAEHYNGQQGDPWDAQKDMALAAAGALVALLCDQCRRIRLLISL